jgi:DNA-binding transcriptional LysR family regulator
LFRTSRQVSLTQAGLEFLQDAKKILTDIEKSISNVRYTAESDPHNIRVSGVDEEIYVFLPKIINPTNRVFQSKNYVFRKFADFLIVSLSKPRPMRTKKF